MYNQRKNDLLQVHILQKWNELCQLVLNCEIIRIQLFQESVYFVLVREFCFRC